MRFEADNIYTAWSELLRAVMDRGLKCVPRGQRTLELIGTQIVVNNFRRNILIHPDRDLNYRFMVAEWLWIMSGDNRVETIARYNKNIKAYSDDGIVFAGAYGPRLKPQLEYMLKTLREDRSSRQAVATVWQPCPEPSKDIPCTVSLQAFIRSDDVEDKLHGVLTMRSNDLWLGAPYDFFNFSQILSWLASRLGVSAGSLTFQAGSSHIYERDFGGVYKVLDNREKGCVASSPELNNFAPSMIWPTPTLSTFSRAEGFYAAVLNSPNKAEALNILRSAWR